jgi:ABC-type nitrate/sulfonate/bicarbonate transport system substrate-binding protein
MDTLEVITFPGTPNLPLYVAQANGYFAAQGLEVILHTTPSSVFQIERVVAGEFQIAGTAIDNVIAYQEGQGAIELATSPDLFVFMGASQVELSLVAKPKFASIADLKNQGIALDALATGFAFVAYWMLEHGGVDPHDCNLVSVGAAPERFAALTQGSEAAALLLEPFTGRAKAQGYRVLASSADILPDYQGGIFCTTRRWATSNEPALTGYIRAYLRALAWLEEAGNCAAARALLLEHIPALTPATVDMALAKVLAPRTGLTPGAVIDLSRVQRVLDLRNRYAPGVCALDEPARYIDLQYYERVCAGLDETAS